MPTFRYQLRYNPHRNKDVEPGWSTSWGVREYTGAHRLLTLSYIPLLCQTPWSQPWIPGAQQLQELGWVWGLSHRRCERQKVKAQCFCSSYHGLCFPKLQSLVPAGALQIPFRNEMLALHYLTRTDKSTTNSPKTHLMQRWETNVGILSTLFFDISLQIGAYICTTPKENHRGFFCLLWSEIRAELSRCFAGNLNLWLRQALAQANHSALGLLKGPEQGSPLVCRFF